MRDVSEATSGGRERGGRKRARRQKRPQTRKGEGKGGERGEMRKGERGRRPPIRPSVWQRAMIEEEVGEGGEGKEGPIAGVVITPGKEGGKENACKEQVVGGEAVGGEGAARWFARQKNLVVLFLF